MKGGKEKKMELKLDLQIENLYGGDGNIRYIEERSTKLIRTKKKRTTKSSTPGMSTDSSTEEEKSELVKKEVQTFKLQDGKPIYRFGGIHGKLWGHMRAAGKMLADLGTDGFDSKAFVDRLMTAVNMTPINVIIEDHEPIQIAEIPQITAGISRALIIQKFDYIPKCKFSMKLVFPEMYKKQVIAILKQSEEIAGMNKRRATLEILNKEVLK